MIAIIPKPNGSVSVQDTRFTIPKEIIVSPDGFRLSCLQAYSERMALPVTEDRENAWLFIKKIDGYKEEAYSLFISTNTVRIEASGERGVIWALTTLYLMTEKGLCPLAIIKNDCPVQKYRGLLLDSARHFFYGEEIKRIIEQIALVKMNVLHWHLSDDQGWRIESKVFPGLHTVENQPYYSQGEIREIVEYAHVRGVEIIPEVDMPGHTTAMIAAYPALSCHGTPVLPGQTGGIFNTVLCPGKENTFEFVFSLLDEVTELFKSSYVHIGGDEVPKIQWQKCDACKKRMDAENLHNFEELQGYFTNRIAGYLKEKGKQPICWNDCLGADNIDKDIPIQFWIGTKEDSAVLSSRKNVLYSDMFYCYFDYPYGAIPLKKVYGYIPEKSIGISPGHPNRMGIEACVWTERIDNNERLERQIFPRVFAIGEIAWSEKRDYRDFARRLAYKLPALTKLGISFTPAGGWNPTGKDRRNELSNYMKLLAATKPKDDDGNTIFPTAPGRQLKIRAFKEFFKPIDIFYLRKMGK